MKIFADKLTLDEKVMGAYVGLSAFSTYFTLGFCKAMDIDIERYEGLLYIGGPASSLLTGGVIVGRRAYNEAKEDEKFEGKELTAGVAFGVGYMAPLAPVTFYNMAWGFGLGYVAGLGVKSLG